MPTHGLSGFHCRQGSLQDPIESDLTTIDHEITRRLGV